MPSAADLRRAAGAVALAAVLAVGGAPAPDAGAATRARVCVTSTVVLDSPGGFTVGYLFRGDRVTISRRSKNRKWARVSTPTDLRGWVRAKNLCRR
ncbi:MAG: hypothetical protein JHD16_01035 [Solirubrobacteraceae bacterium]|nr:hypothetical protein [Solirubrobacteraceae bacterium]